MNHHHVENFLLLALLSVAYSTALVRIESLRLAVKARHVPNILNLWVFAGVLLLPLPLLVALVLIAYAGEWPARRMVGQPRHRYIYSALAYAASAAAASHTLHHIHSPIVGVSAAALVFTTVDMALIAAVMTIARHFQAMRMFLSVEHHLSELATLCGGVILTVAMNWHPTTAVGALPALAVLHRSALAEAVRSSRSFDTRTGLWTEPALRIQGLHMLRDNRYVALFIIDPARPDMEAEIAANLPNGMRRTDLIGHYGTRQVAVMMPGGYAGVGRVNREFIRDSLADACISSAIGYAVTDGTDLEALVIAAVCNLMESREQAGVKRPW